MGLIFICVFGCHSDGTVPHITLIGDTNCNVTILRITDIVPMIRAVLHQRCQFHCHLINSAYVTGFGNGFAGISSVIRLSAAAKHTGIYVFSILECSCCSTLICSAMRKVGNQLSASILSVFCQTRKSCSRTRTVLVDILQNTLGYCCSVILTCARFCGNSLCRRFCRFGFFLSRLCLWLCGLCWISRLIGL